MTVSVCRWDEDESVVSGPATVHRYILHYFLEDGTIEMRELADIKGGNYFEGRFPVMIRRQKVFKGGSTPSLSVDRIGGDRAVAAAATRPRSARRVNGGGASSGIGSGGSLFSDRGGAGGRGSGDDLGDDLGETLSPLDLIVGRQVLLMKRPMVVCGWDETTHVWWETLTGTNMRGLQGDLEDFQRCIHPGQSQPRPPNKPKSSFYEGPPQRTGTLRERFFKASENSGKTLRFLAKATQDTKTTSTRDNVFIIRFYPEDDALSVYTSHNLGKNAGGLYRGVYLARCHDMVNEATGEPFKARDFHIGSVAKLPSVSLEIVDVDDFSRHYLARETSSSDSHWQTAPMWSRLLALATASGAEVTESAEARANVGAHKHVGFHPSDGDGAGAAEESLQPSDNGALEKGSSHENHAARGGGGGGGAAATVPAPSALGPTCVLGGPPDDARGEVDCDHGGGGRAATESAVVKAGVVSDEINPAAWSSDHGGGQRLSVGGCSFPAVVVEGEGATPATNGGGPHSQATAGEEPGAEAANGGPQKRLERQLDLRGVVLDAHEV
ncbi:unnamed protein product, partial [Ectocarpus sp. 13 AM-2016]